MEDNYLEVIFNKIFYQEFIKAAASLTCPDISGKEGKWWGLFKHYRGLYGRRD
jgi:hypothetical protein